MDRLEYELLYRRNRCIIEPNNTRQTQKANSYHCAETTAAAPAPAKTVPTVPMTAIPAARVTMASAGHSAFTRVRMSSMSMVAPQLRETIGGGGGGGGDTTNVEPRPANERAKLCEAKEAGASKTDGEIDLVMMDAGGEDGMSVAGGEYVAPPLAMCPRRTWRNKWARILNPLRLRRFGVDVGIFDACSSAATKVVVVVVIVFSDGGGEVTQVVVVPVFRMVEVMVVIVVTMCVGCCEVVVVTVFLGVK